ncbi:MAG: biopolymer transporter ExbD [Deltaproteobacteria bacterium]|nr:biopolymer transporter ExbD [Deltaproteobacteria bacterium]
MAFGSPKNQNDSELNAEINIIPMVDIMLVLLIIFMVAAPLMNDTVDVTLPKAKAKSAGMEEEAVVVAIRKDQSIYIGRTQVGFAELNKKLAAIYANREKKDLILRGDESVPYGFIIKVMANIQSAGVYKISFFTDPTN